MKRGAATSIIFIAIAAVLLLKLFVFSPKSPSSQKGKGFGQGRGKGPIAVHTAGITHGALKERREFTGTVKAAYSYVVAAKVPGRLMTIHKRIGDRVGFEERLGRIDTTEYHQALEEARAQLNISRAAVAEAQSQHTYYQREKERINELLDKGIASQAELDAIEMQSATQKSRLDLAEAQLAQKEVALAQARTRFAYTAIRAAQPGYIAQRHTDGGALLSVNSPVLTVVGIDTVYVEIAVTERDYRKIKPGQNAEVIVEALPDRVFHGNIRQTASSFRTESRTATVEVSVVNDSLLLKPGMFARILVTLSERDSVQIVPAASVITRNGKMSLFMVENGTARQVPIEVGIVEGDLTEIEHPVLKGKIVIMGQHLLTDGSAVIEEKIDSGVSGKKSGGDE